MNITAFDIAQRFVGIKEVPGSGSSHQVMTFLTLDASWPGSDDVPWCSGFVNYVAWLLRLPRSKSLRARSWLEVGLPIQIDQAVAGDIVVLKQESADPGPEVLAFRGHVGFLAGQEGDDLLVLGGNQSNEVKVQRYPKARLLGVRRIDDSFTRHF